MMIRKFDRIEKMLFFNEKLLTLASRDNNGSDQGWIPQYPFAYPFEICISVLFLSERGGFG